MLTRKLVSLLVMGLCPSVALGQLAPSASSPISTADPANSSLPEKILLPWSTPGIDARTRSAASSALQRSFDEMKAQWIGGASSLLSDLPEGRQLSRNALRFSGQIAVSNTNSLERSLFLQPIWCRIGNQQIIALQMGDGYGGMLLESFHQAHADQTDSQLPSPPQFDWIPALTQHNLSEIKNRTLPINTNDRNVKLGLELLNTSTRADRGSNQCLNTILAESLIAIHRVQFATGLESLVHARWQRGINQPLQRANRTIAVGWYPVIDKIGSAITLPARYRADFEYSEAVFSSPVGQEKKIDYTVGLNQNRIIIQPHSGLSEFIRLQENALAASDRPQIAHIYGAWVYLDKGRAYGLKINDRLVAQNGTEIIKGHIIGFFGSKVGLKSPRGYPIDEGAIAFIRKGQTQVKIGLEFDFDQTSYPTDYPPKSAANAGNEKKR